MLIGLLSFLFIGFHNFTRPNALMGSTKTQRELLSCVVGSKGSVRDNQHAKEESKLSITKD